MEHKIAARVAPKVEGVDKVRSRVTGRFRDVGNVEGLNTLMRVPSVNTQEWLRQR